MTFYYTYPHICDILMGIIVSIIGQAVGTVIAAVFGVLMIVLVAPLWLCMAIAGVFALCFGVHQAMKIWKSMPLTSGRDKGYH